MAGPERPMSFLPSIKCSDCGIDIEIAFLADHICAVAQPSTCTIASPTCRVDTNGPAESQTPADPRPPRNIMGGRDPAIQDGGFTAYSPNPQFDYNARPRASPLQQQRGFARSPAFLEPQMSPGYSKPGRNAPPRIDPAAASKLLQLQPPRLILTAADRPFFPADVATPGSNYSNYSESRSLTPLTPSTNLTSPASFMSRRPGNMSRTPSPPSPDLQANLDSAFPPFPRPSPKPQRKPFPEPINTKRPDGLAVNNVSMAPLSPRTNGGAHVMKRMDGIAPGPFAGMGLRTQSRSPPLQPERQQVERRSSEMTDRVQLRNSKGREHFRKPSPNPSNHSRSSSRSSSSAEEYRQGDREHRRKPSRPAEAIDRFFEEMQESEASYGRDPRSNAQSNVRAAPPMRSMNSGRERQPSYDPAVQQGFGRVDIMSPIRSAGLSPPPNPYGWRDEEDNGRRPSTSRGRSPAPMHDFPLPPVQQPQPPQQYRAFQPATPQWQNQAPKPMMTNASRAESVSSSNPSSMASSKAPSRVSSQSDWSNEEMPAAANRSKSVASQYSQTSRHSGYSQRRGRSNTMASNRSQSAEPVMRSAIALEPLAPARPTFNYMKPLESPVDPAIQFGLMVPAKPKLVNTPARDRSPRPPPKREDNFESRYDERAEDRTLDRFDFQFGAQARDNKGAEHRMQESLTSERPRMNNILPSRQQETVVSLPTPNGMLSLPTPHKSKGLCSGCRLPIMGKFVRTADGRLPGRYHKECFGCQTCHSPFPTGEFYVLNDAPYCGEHYHELNGSTCKLCHRGIEGQYLETDRADKFHAHCFACTKCQIPLAEDYFEVEGAPYCQRHAFAVVKVDASGRPGVRANVERRRTRLMMM